MLAELQQIRWAKVPETAVALRDKYAASAAAISAAIEDLPRGGFLDLWQNGNDLVLNVGDWCESADLAAWETTLEPLCDDLRVESEIGNPGAEWVKIAFRYRELPYQVKQAASAALRSLGQIGGYVPGGWADALGGPTPLSGMLASGMIGAGLGYGAGWLGEQVLPRDWRRGRLRRALSLAGGLAGATPGALAVFDNWHKGRNLNSGALMGYSKPDEVQYYHSQHPDFDPAMPYVPVDYKSAAAACRGELDSSFKQAFSRTGWELDTELQGPSPIIPIDSFNQTIYRDPFVSSQLSPPIQAAASGLMEAAYNSQPRPGARLVSPMDIARVSAGMGSGYLSGAIVGKALGALVGMPQPAQDQLKQTGMWAGLVANLVPLAFGARG